MSKRETPPSPFSEATVVQSRNAAPTPPPLPNETKNDKLSENDGGEKTVVQGRSNLKETFDARTVVRTASSFPPEMPSPPKAPAPQIPDVPVVAKVAVAKEVTNPAFEQTGGAVKLSSAVEEEKPKKKTKDKEPREPRKPLDQRSKLLIASFAVVAALALLFVFSGSDETDSAPKQAQENPATPDQGQESMASEQPGQPDQAKFQQLAGPPAATTADVLNRFDKASARAQERAEQYSRSGGGF